MNWLDSLIVTFRGKRLGVLGSQQVGKTVLQVYLRSGELKTTYAPTLGRSRLKGGRQTVKTSDGGNRRLPIKKGHDLGGRFKNREEAWMEATQKSDLLLYVFDAHRLLEDDGGYASEIQTHCKAIAHWMEESTPEHVALIGTHCDLIVDLKSESRQDPYRRIRGALEATEVIDAISLAIGKPLGSAPPMVLGSLKSVQGASKLRDAIAQELDS